MSAYDDLNWGDAPARAGEKTLKSAQNAIAFQRQVGADLEADAKPLLDLRNTNYNRLTALTNGNQGEFFASPEYAAVHAAANSVEGAPEFAQSALEDRGKFLADSEYGNHYNRLTKLAGIGSDGLNTSNQQITANNNYLANLVTSAGDDAASQIMQQAGQKSSAGSSAVGIFAAFSDATLKDDIRKLLQIGPLWWCEWRWNRAIDQPPCGFIAQEVCKYVPEAVHRDPSGFLKVNYSMVFAWLCK